MDRRNDPDTTPSSGAPGASRSPWGAGAAEAPPPRRRDPWNGAWRRHSDPSPGPSAPPPAGIPLSTPLVWVWGGMLLAVTMWLSSMVALFRSFGSLFH